MNDSLRNLPLTETKQSVCPLDCPDRCSLRVELRDGKVMSIRGSPLNALTAGFICTKVSRFGMRLTGPDRLRFPLKRTGRKGSGLFVRISWDQALSEITAQIRKAVADFGGEAILPFHYGGSNGLMTDGFTDAAFFRRLGASRLARTLCAASTSAATKALYGKMPGVAFEEYANARLIILWGANPKHSNIHLVPHLKEARRRGCRIAVVDPRRTMGNDLVDLYLQIYPGTDVVLALAMIRFITHQYGLTDRTFLEEHSTGWRELLDYSERYHLADAARICGIPAKEIAFLAQGYAAANPALIRCGWGLERNRNGLAAVAAVLALPAVAGKFGTPGGGYTLSNSAAYKVDDDVLAGLPECQTRVLNMNLLGRYLTDGLNPPIKVLFVYNCNPGATLPDHNGVLSGLEREDLFTVVFEQVMTDTANYADIILPATTFLEHRELNKSYGGYAVQLSEPVIAPLDEAKCNAEVFQSLGKAMGWSDPVFTEDPEALLLRAVGSVRAPMEAGYGPEALRKSKIAYFDFPGRRPVQFATVFPGTSDGKIHLYPAELGPEPYRYLDDPATSEFPLALISPSSDKSISSTLAEFNMKTIKLAMHPEDAAVRSLCEGDLVRIFNQLGEVHCALHLDTRLRPGVISLSKGIWKRATLNGGVGNSLVPDSVTAVSGGACFNDARVEVEKLFVGERMFGGDGRQ